MYGRRPWPRACKNMNKPHFQIRALTHKTAHGARPGYRRPTRGAHSKASRGSDFARNDYKVFLDPVCWQPLAQCVPHAKVRARARAPRCCFHPGHVHIPKHNTDTHARKAVMQIEQANEPMARCTRLQLVRGQDMIATSRSFPTGQERTHQQLNAIHHSTRTFSDRTL